MTQTLQDTDVYRLRVAFERNAQMFYGDFERLVSGYQSFLDVSLHAAISSDLPRLDSLGLVYRSSADAWGSRSKADRFILHRVSYNSPLEIVVWLPIVYGVGVKALELFNGYQDARRKKAETDTVVDSEAYLRRAIAIEGAKLALEQQRALERALPEAARALEEMTELGEDNEAS